MPLDGERQIVRAHASTVVGNANEAFAATGCRNFDTRRTGIDSIFYQFLGRAGRSFDNLASGDLVDERF